MPRFLKQILEYINIYIFYFIFNITCICNDFWGVLAQGINAFLSEWEKSLWLIYFYLNMGQSIYGELWCLLNQPHEATLVSSTVPACRILAKYLRRNNDLEIFSVVKRKLYFSSYRADIQAQVSTTFENSLLWKCAVKMCSEAKPLVAENFTWAAEVGSELSAAPSVWHSSRSLRYSIHSAQKSSASSHRGLPWTVGRCGFCHLCFQSLPCAWYR